MTVPNLHFQGLSPRRISEACFSRLCVLYLASNNSLLDFHTPILMCTTSGFYMVSQFPSPGAFENNLQTTLDTSIMSNLQELVTETDTRMVTTRDKHRESTITIQEMLQRQNGKGCMKIECMSPERWLSCSESTLLFQRTQVWQSPVPSTAVIPGQGDQTPSSVLCWHSRVHTHQYIHIHIFKDKIFFEM